MVRVDQQRDVDPVAGHERQSLEQLTAGGDLARERLLDRREVRVEQVQQRPRRQLGDAAAAVRERHVTDLERPLVEALDERQTGVAHERTEQTTEEVRPELLRVRVQEADDVAGQHVQRPPHRVALAQHVSELRCQAPLIVHLGAQVARDLCGSVGRMIDHYNLVDHAEISELEQRFENCADRTSLVAGRKADRDRRVSLSREPRGPKLRVRIGIRAVPGPCAERHPPERMTAGDARASLAASSAGCRITAGGGGSAVCWHGALGRGA